MSDEKLQDCFKSTNELFSNAFGNLQANLGSSVALEIITSPVYAEVLLLKVANTLDEATGENV